MWLDRMSATSWDPTKVQSWVSDFRLSGDADSAVEGEAVNSRICSKHWKQSKSCACVHVHTRVKEKLVTMRG